MHCTISQEQEQKSKTKKKNTPMIQIQEWKYEAHRMFLLYLLETVHSILIWFKDSCQAIERFESPLINRNVPLTNLCITIIPISFMHVHSAI